MHRRLRSLKIRLWIIMGFVFLLCTFHGGSIIGIFSLYNFKQYEVKLETFFSVTITPNVTTEELLIQGSPLNSTPNEAFITYADNNPTYLALLINLLDSIHYFSKRPIIAYGIDVDLDIDVNKYPRLIKRRINRKDCGQSVYFCKIYAIIDSKLDYGVHIDADSVVNYNIDILFDVIRRWPYPLPLAPRHPDDPLDYQHFLTLFSLNLTSRTIPYIHAHLSWNYRAYPFFKIAFRLMRQGYFMGANYEETGINILLWKARANHTLCMVDPHVVNLPNYESKQQTCDNYCHSAFIIIHGSKNITEMQKAFRVLKSKEGSPFIQTSHYGFHYLNETKYTCCYADSQRSTIHPLLCLHSKYEPR